MLVHGKVQWFPFLHIIELFSFFLFHFFAAEFCNFSPCNHCLSHFFRANLCYGAFCTTVCVLSQPLVPFSSYSSFLSVRVWQIVQGVPRMKALAHMQRVPVKAQKGKAPRNEWLRNKKRRHLIWSKPCIQPLFLSKDRLLKPLWPQILNISPIILTGLYWDGAQMLEYELTAVYILFMSISS